MGLFWRFYRTREAAEDKISKFASFFGATSFADNATTAPAQDAKTGLWFRWHGTGKADFTALDSELAEAAVWFGDNPSKNYYMSGPYKLDPRVGQALGDAGQAAAVRGPLISGGAAVVAVGVVAAGPAVLAVSAKTATTVSAAATATGAAAQRWGGQAQYQVNRAITWTQDVYNSWHQGWRGVATEYLDEMYGFSGGFRRAFAGPGSGRNPFSGNSDRRPTTAEAVELERRRLPKTKGSWSGDPGESDWNSSKPSVTSVTGGEGIPFRSQRVDFSKWSISNVKIRIDGTNRDFHESDKALSVHWGVKAADVKWFRETFGYTWHRCGSGNW